MYSLLIQCFNNVCTIHTFCHQYIYRILLTRFSLTFNTLDFPYFCQLVRETHTHAHILVYIVCYTAVTFSRKAIFNWLVASVIIFSLVCAQYSHLSNESTEFFFSYSCSYWVCFCVFIKIDKKKIIRTPAKRKFAFFFSLTEKKKKEAHKKK